MFPYRFPSGNHLPSVTKLETAKKPARSLRKPFFAAGVPVSLQGVGGPGAPREFLLERRDETGTLPMFSLVSFTRVGQNY